MKDKVSHCQAADLFTAVVTGCLLNHLELFVELSQTRFFRASLSSCSHRTQCLHIHTVQPLWHPSLHMQVNTQNTMSTYYTVQRLQHPLLQVQVNTQNTMSTYPHSSTSTASIAAYASKHTEYNVYISTQFNVYSIHCCKCK